ncbi:MAG: hypothetical protein KJN87_03935 [Desulfofustis sp.]|nr:hypothetical protein [Desulfofustis sp.]NNF45802.1 hypothetical protein [Desulfofustis sp.]
MKKLQLRHLRWLKVVHLTCVSCWIGGAISGELDLATLRDQEYLYDQHMNLWFGTPQVATLLFTVWISVF